MCFKISKCLLIRLRMKGWKDSSFFLFFFIRILFRVCMHMVVSEAFCTTMFRDTDRDRGFEKQSLIWDLPSTTAVDIYIFGVLSLFPKVSFLSTWERCNSIRVSECTFAQLGGFNASSDIVNQLDVSWFREAFFLKKKIIIWNTKTLSLSSLSPNYSSLMFFRSLIRHGNL